ncbi:MAG: hypothetical protein H6871_04000 [Methylobacteriaceae bacterium]|nr:hypothetical protein [Methylobacteriaceae bacterium]
MSDLIPNVWTFLALTLIIGGAGAFVTGRTMAQTWRERWKAIAYMVPLAGAVRFLHYALFDEPSDFAHAAPTFILLTGFALAGFAYARRRQLQDQYPWLTS